MLIRSRGHAAAGHLEGTGVGAAPRSARRRPWCGILSFRAVSTSREARTGLKFGPRQRMGPPLSLVSPCLRPSQSGWSVAWPTSTAMPKWGLTA